MTHPISKATAKLARATSMLRFSAPVAHVYYPLNYASALVAQFEDRFGGGPKDVLFFGMNPGPFGMGQTGIPFGEVSFVRDWMQITGNVTPPRHEHPKRPITGLACTRSEVSGKRLWGAFAARFPKPEDFFARALVVNYCPLLFLSETGSNVTPDKIKGSERQALEAVCDTYARDLVKALAPQALVGVGQYAEKRLQLIFGDSLQIACIPHPSPASPAANRGWEPLAKAAMEKAGLPGFF